MRRLAVNEINQVSGGVSVASVALVLGSTVAGGAMGLIYGIKQVPHTCNMAYIGMPLEYAVYGALGGLSTSAALVAML